MSTNKTTENDRKPDEPAGCAVAEPSAPSLTLPETNNITFHCGQAHQEIMRLDKDGMTYKGQRIEDGGEAHRAFLEVMSAMRK